MTQEVTDAAIQEAQARTTVQVHLPGGQVLEGERGLQLAAFLEDTDRETAPIVGAIVNGELRELTYPIELESQVRPVTMGEEDGMPVYTITHDVELRNILPPSEVYLKTIALGLKETFGWDPKSIADYLAGRAGISSYLDRKRLLHIITA